MILTGFTFTIKHEDLAEVLDFHTLFMIFMGLNRISWPFAVFHDFLGGCIKEIKDQCVIQPSGGAQHRLNSNGIATKDQRKSSLMMVIIHP